MRQHDAFGLARRATGKNNRRDVTELCLVLGAGIFFDEPCWKEKRPSSAEAFAKTRFLRQVFEKNGLCRRLYVHTLKEGASRDHRLQAALLRARLQRFV